MTRGDRSGTTQREPSDSISLRSQVRERLSAWSQTSLGQRAAQIFEAVALVGVVVWLFRRAWNGHLFDIFFVLVGALVWELWGRHIRANVYLLLRALRPRARWWIGRRRERVSQQEEQR